MLDSDYPKKFSECSNCGSSTPMKKIIENSSALDLEHTDSFPREAKARFRCIECGWEDNQPRWNRFVEESTDGVQFQCGKCGNWFGASTWRVDHICKTDKSS